MCDKIEASCGANYLKVKKKGVMSSIYSLALERRWQYGIFLKRIRKS